MRAACLRSSAPNAVVPLLPLTCAPACLRLPARAGRGHRLNTALVLCAVGTLLCFSPAFLHFCAYTFAFLTAPAPREPRAILCRAHTLCA